MLLLRGFNSFVDVIKTLEWSTKRAILILFFGTLLAIEMSLFSEDIFLNSNVLKSFFSFSVFLLFSLFLSYSYNLFVVSLITGTSILVSKLNGWKNKGELNDYTLLIVIPHLVVVILFLMCAHDIVAIKSNLIFFLLFFSFFMSFFALTLFWAYYHHRKNYPQKFQIALSGLAVFFNTVLLYWLALPVFCLLIKNVITTYF